MNWKPFFCIALAAWGGLIGVWSAEPEVFIDIESVEPGEVTWNYETGLIVATNTFVVRYQGAVLTARRGELHQETGELTAEGSVVLQRDTQTWRGDRIQYNFLTGEIQTERFRAGLAPVFAAGDALAANPTNGTYTASNAYVTTDDVETPGYRVRAKSLVLAPGRYVEARNAVVYLGKVPVFYFPYYRRHLDRLANYFTVTPGYRSLYGPFALGAYHWFWDDRLYGALNLDYRAKRGFGGGPDVHYDFGRWGAGEFRYYYLYDQDPSLSQRGTNVVDIGHSRDRISFLHSADLLTNLTAKVAVRRQSDIYVIRDFFETEYRENPQPSSYGELDYRWSNFSLNALGMFQVNDFFETVERLPDVKLTGLRQQLGVSPFYYESDSSFGYFRRRFADNLTNDYAAMRGDSYHQLLIPLTFFDWLNVTPRAGGRFTYYGESEGTGTTLQEQDRWIFNTGAEVSLKASRVWAGARNRLLDVNDLRHIVQPSLNYVYVPTPNRLPPELPQFDYEHPSLRLLPLDFPDYNSIDSIDSMNAVRIGLRNKLQTKREEGVENLLNWAVYADWRINPRPDQQTFSDLYSDLDLRPRSWLNLGSMVRYGIDDAVLRESDHRLTVSPNTVWSVALGHRYLREDPAAGLVPGNNLFYDTLYYRLNEDWGLRASHRFEAEDGTLEEQLYTLYRDFRSWTGALSFRVRDNRDGPTDYGVSFTFSLKAVPRYPLGDDRNRPTQLLGY